VSGELVRGERRRALFGAGSGGLGRVIGIELALGDGGAAEAPPGLGHLGEEHALGVVAGLPLGLQVAAKLLEGLAIFVREEQGIGDSAGIEARGEGQLLRAIRIAIFFVHRQIKKGRSRWEPAQVI
jgi:hypothetical protein